MTAYVEEMFSVRQRPWHGIGSVLDEAPSVEDAIKMAKLNWRAELVPIKAVWKTEDVSQEVEVPNRFAICRMREPDFIDGNHIKNVFSAVVTEKYGLLQNSEAFNFFQDILDEFPSVKLDTAGCLKDGEVTWILADIGEEINLGMNPNGNDVVKKYLLLSNSYNGKWSVKVSFTPVRVVCWNTLSIAVADVDIKFPHRKNVKDMLDKAKFDFYSTLHTYEEIGRLYNNMKKFVPTDQEIDSAINFMIPIDTGINYTDRQLRRIQSQREIVFKNFETEALLSNNTVWGLYNAMTGYVDHDMKTRKDPLEKLHSIWFATGAKRKTDALDYFVRQYVHADGLDGWLKGVKNDN